MKEFFVNEVIDIEFVLFNWTHILLLFLTILGIIFIYLFRKKIKNINIKTKNIIKNTIVIIMFLNMVVYYNMYAYYGIYDWKVHLPLHFCFISGFLFMFALLTNNKKIYKITYFWSFIGPLPAILWPDVTDVNSFVFFQYIISHHFFLLSSLFIFYSYDIDIKEKDILNAFLISNLIFIIMIIFNAVFQTNYIMSKDLPVHFINQYPIFSHVSHPILLLEPAGILGIIIAYIPVYLRRNEIKK